MSVSKIDQTRFTKHEGNGSSATKPLQEPLHSPRPKPWWKRILTLEKLTVAGREVKGLVVPYWAAGVLLAAIISIGWAGYTSGKSEQRETRDAIIRMETMLNERTKMFDRQQDKFEQDLKDERSVAELKRDLHEKRVWKMEQAMVQNGIKIVD